MPDDQQLLVEARRVATSLLSEKLSKNIKFHTLLHTEEVVKACDVLADHYKIDGQDRIALGVAAWFHDTGYTSGDAKDHETLSIRLATNFLNEQNASDELKNKVVGCINATRMPQNPTNDLEKIICDADLFHLGTESFDEKSKLLRQELNEFANNDVSKKDWRRINIRFLERHEYFTSYGRENLAPAKQTHLAELLEKDKNHDDMKPDKKDKIKEKDKDRDREKSVLSEKELEAKAKAKAKADKEKQSERGIATVFRIMAQNQNNLSQMADAKANILISVNSIILTIVLSTLSTKIQGNPNLLIPTIMLVIVCVSAIVFSILATRPNVSHGTFTQDDIHNKRTNLLFFGNFYRTSLNDYDWAMQELLADKDYLYSSIVKDNYFLGVVLAKKYRLLRYAYNIFMYGLVITMLGFGIAFAIPEATVVYEPGS